MSQLLATYFKQVEPDEEPIEITGKFMGFGTDYQELAHGVGTYSVVLVLLEDGSIDNPPVEHVKLSKVVPLRIVR